MKKKKPIKKKIATKKTSIKKTEKKIKKEKKATPKQIARESLLDILSESCGIFEGVGLTESRRQKVKKFMAKEIIKIGKRWKFDLSGTKLEEMSEMETSIKREEPKKQIMPKKREAVLVENEEDIEPKI